MRVLLTHPEDSPLLGPWAEQRWDLIVDLGRSSPFSEERWSKKYSCPVLRTEAVRRGIEDVKAVRALFSEGRGRLLDHEGMDWWELLSLLVEQDVRMVRVIARIAADLDPSADVWATRRTWPVSAVEAVTGRPVQGFDGSYWVRSAARVRHYANLTRRFSPAQLKEIFLDKYDGGYQWRARFAATPPRASEPVVLVPSAYVNVSRMAAEYAQMLPRQAFLMVATRRNATRLTLPDNVQYRDLAGYARTEAPKAEIASLVEQWSLLTQELFSSPEYRVLFGAGVFNLFPQWLREGLCTRDAWRAVFDRESVRAVLCGDDSNLYTRIPVLLAVHRKIPTLDFHHGAFDGRYLLKDLFCDLYLAKNAMEMDYLVRVCGLPRDRIVVGAPQPDRARHELHDREQTSAVFFSEPFESAGMRAEEAYAEIMPPLCKIARQHGRNVIVKLHPFESRPHRVSMLAAILKPEDLELVTVVDGPLSGDLLPRAWFALTVESTAALHCVQAGVRCFICGWLAYSPYEYVAQYARFGVGEILQNAHELLRIPDHLERSGPPPAAMNRPNPVDPIMLQRWLSSLDSETEMRTA
jgi:hypothetical protein